MSRRAFGVVTVLLGIVAWACGEDGDNAPSLTGDDAGIDGAIAPDDAAIVPADASVGADAEAGDADADAGPDPRIPLVYAHSPSVLYRIDPTTQAVVAVGPFTGGCDDVIDIAVDESSRAFVTTFTGLYRLDLETANCTLVNEGGYPNSLSFVPKGTVDPDVEALVGYAGATYIRIDTTTGAVTTIGALTGGYVSSGDIVSSKTGGTYLTVVGNGCSDCLVEVNPTTGAFVKNLGALDYTSVYGLAFWNDTFYGFTEGGSVFSVADEDGGLVTKPVPIAADASVGLQFWGAGSSTAAPGTGVGDAAL